MDIPRKGVYVERTIRGSLDALWEYTQTPELHERWDVRFTGITYLPRSDDSHVQRFLYSTRVGFGLKIQGHGETVAGRGELPTQQTSALKFWSDDPKSLIQEGSGYWKYVLVADGVRFVTGYDYRVRFGVAGQAFDKLVFRPLIGWATAWSFDRLRLWVEDGIDPASSLRASMMHAVGRLSLALVWLYQGAVPKLIFQHAGELALLRDAGVRSELAPMLLQIIGWGEVTFGVIFLVLWHAAWPTLITMALMVATLLGVGLTSPATLIAPFNPVTLNLLMIGAALIERLSSKNLPSARHALRKNPEVKS